MDVNFVGRNNFGNNAYTGSFNPRPFLSNSSNNCGNSYDNSYGNYNKMPSDFESNIKEFISLQKSFNTLIEEKMSKIDELARSVDIISLDVDSLKFMSIPPKHDINESLKATRISMMSAKKEPLGCMLKKIAL